MRAANFYLFSGARIFTEGFDINLTHRRGNELVRIDDATGITTRLPLEFDEESQSWIGRVLLNRNVNAAAKLARRLIERHKEGKRCFWFDDKRKFLTCPLKAMIVRRARAVEVKRNLQSNLPRREGNRTLLKFIHSSDAASSAPIYDIMTVAECDEVMSPPYNLSEEDLVRYGRINGSTTTRQYRFENSK